MKKSSSYFKYTRTLHLPWSLGISSDDKILPNTLNFANKQVVVTEKMDGENTSMYNDHIHARSVDSKHHPSRNWVKALHGEIAHKIPPGWRICGENMFATHSIPYYQLDSYFYVFSIWDQDNFCLSWEDTVSYTNKLGLSIPPILYIGLWDERKIRSLEINTESSEGYVVRISDKFHYDDYSANCAKFVRQNHVQSDEHWMHQSIVPNQLK